MRYKVIFFRTAKLDQS